MHFTQRLGINSLFWLTSLRDDEKGVTRRVWEDLLGVFAVEGLPAEMVEITSAIELHAALTEIARLANLGAKPMIHFDCHGSLERGLWIAASDEYVSWSELISLLRDINKACGNNLCVVSACCFSFEAVRFVDIHLTAPFGILIAPEGEVNAGFLEENMVAFYREIFALRDISSAVEARLKANFRTFHSERMLAYVLIKYIDQGGMGRRLQERREALMKMAVPKDIELTKQTMAELRQLRDNMTKPTEELIERFIPVFLAGKAPAFTVKQLVDEVRKARAAGIPPGQF